MCFGKLVMLAASLISWGATIEDDFTKDTKQYPVKFSPPVRLDIESDMYLAPYAADMNSDGQKDLLVGQFTDGRIMVYLHPKDGTFGEFSGSDWLQTEGEVVQIPGIW